MKNLVRLTLLLSLCSLALAADDQAKESKATDRVQAAADVLNQIESAPDSAGWRVVARRRVGARRRFS